mgnify:CR=1 FL=1
MAEIPPDYLISRGGQKMNLKELIFGEGVHTGGSGGVYRDSVQAWLPIKNIIGGVVITKDNRFVKIMEVLPVNIYLKSAIDQQNIISSFASYLQIAPDELQMIARTLPADTQAYVEQMQRYAEQEENEACREMIEDNIREIGHGIAGGAMRAVLESVGIRNVLAKSKGSSNPHNLVKATVAALLELRDARSVAQVRGVSLDTVFNG